nr:IS3 family transposase [Actinomyces slackii]
MPPGYPTGRLLREERPVSQRYELINREEGNYPIASMCRWSRVSRSGYYSWRDRPQSRRDIRRQELVALIEAEFEASDGTYGYRRITARLGRRGVVVHHDTVRCLMRQAGLVAAQPRRKVRTTTPAADLEGRPDLVERDFTATAPGTKWVGDITYIRTWVGFVYLATVLDCATKKVVGYAMAEPHAHQSGV